MAQNREQSSLTQQRVQELKQIYDIEEVIVTIIIYFN
jgi:hypothetical protein